MATKQKFSLESLCFYFDGITTEARDRSRRSRRNGEINDLRDKLLVLGDSDYESTMALFRKSVDELYRKALHLDQNEKSQTAAGHELYGRSTSGSSQIVSAI